MKRFLGILARMVIGAIVGSVFGYIISYIIGFFTSLLFLAVAPSSVDVLGTPTDVIHLLPFGRSFMVRFTGLIVGSLSGALSFGLKKFSVGLFASLAVSILHGINIYSSCMSCSSTSISLNFLMLIYPVTALITGIFVSLISILILKTQRLGSLLNK